MGIKPLFHAFHAPLDQFKVVFPAVNRRGQASKLLSKGGNLNFHAGHQVASRKGTFYRLA